MNINILCYHIFYISTITHYSLYIYFHLNLLYLFTLLYFKTHTPSLPLHFYPCTNSYFLSYFSIILVILSFSIIILSIFPYISPSPLHFTLIYSTYLLPYILTLIHHLTSPLLPLYYFILFLLIFYNISNIHIVYHHIIYMYIYPSISSTFHPNLLYLFTLLYSNTHTPSLPHHLSPCTNLLIFSYSFIILVILTFPIIILSICISILPSTLLVYYYVLILIHPPYLTTLHWVPIYLFSPIFL